MKTMTLLVTTFLMAMSLVAAPVIAGSDMHHGKGHSEGHHEKCDCQGKHGGHHGKHDKHGHKGHHGKKSSILRHKDVLGLNDDQVKKIKALQNETKKATIQLKADIDIAEIDLKGMKYADPVDMNQVSTLMKNIASKQADIRIAWQQFKVDSKAVLTDEQKKKLKDIYMKKYSHKNGGHGHGHKGSGHH